MKKACVLFMVCIAMVFVSCSKDDDDPTFSPDGKRLVSKIRTVDADHEQNYYEMSFQYDKDGQIEKIIERGQDVDDYYDEEWIDTYTFTRSGNKITSKNEYTYTDNKENDTETETYITVYNLNDKGYISQYEWIDEDDNERIIQNTHTYDADGLLTKRTRKENEGTLVVNEYTYEYEWLNGNLIVQKQLGSSYTTNYTYTNKENKANIDFGAFWGEIDYDGSNYDNLELFGYLGHTNNNYLEKFSTSYSQDTYTYEYTFDGNGYVTKIQKYNSSNKLIRTYTIEYK